MFSADNLILNTLRILEYKRSNLGRYSGTPVAAHYSGSYFFQFEWGRRLRASGALNAR